MQPSYLADITTKVIRRHETFIDPEVLDYLLKKLRGQRLTPRQEECAAFIAKGLSNDDIALRMGYLNHSGKPDIGPLENLVSELYSFFGIEGAPAIQVDALCWLTHMRLMQGRGQSRSLIDRI